MPILFSYWYIPECPSDCATCSFLSSYSPQCNLCFAARGKSYVVEMPTKPRRSSCERVTGGYLAVTIRNFAEQLGAVTLPSGGRVLFLSFNWVHVNWMSSNFFALVLAPCYSSMGFVHFLPSFFSSIPMKDTETKIYYIIYIWLEKWHLRMNIHFYGNV